MAKKVCAYKNCYSYQDAEHVSPFTFFSFPVDPKRARLWKELSQCEESSPKFLCSKHFDKNKYIADNPRRKTLLYTAVPFKYGSSNNEINESNQTTELAEPISLHIDNNKKVLTETLHSEHNKIDDEDEETLEYVLIQNETSLEDNTDIEEDKTNCNLSQLEKDIEINLTCKKYTEDDISDRKKSEKSISIAVTPNNQCYKRKEFTTNVIPTTKHRKIEKSAPDVDKVQQNSPNLQKRIASKTVNIFGNQDNKSIKEIINDKNVEIVLNEEDNAEELEMYVEEEEEEINNTEVSTFIFKGEEYVQMPKSFYLKEKAKIRKQMICYKNMIENIKTVLRHELNFITE